MLCLSFLSVKVCLQYAWMYMCVCVCVQTRGDVAAAGDGTEAGAQPHGDDGGRHGLYQFVDELCSCWL